MAKMKPDDPAYWMLSDGFTSTPIERIYQPDCYICNDPEFAQMGLPLCYECIFCGAHVAADHNECVNGHIQPEDPEDEIYLEKLYTLKANEWREEKGKTK